MQPQFVELYNYIFTLKQASFNYMLMFSSDLLDQLHIVGWSDGFADTWAGTIQDPYLPVFIATLGQHTKPSRQVDMPHHMKETELQT